MILKNTVALVTGSARGIGRVIAQTLVEQGSKVALVDILEDELEETSAEFRTRGGHVLPVKTDITDLNQVKAMGERIETELGPVDILINNAGTFSVVDTVWECDPERWFRDIKVNLYGSFLVSHVVVKGMVERKRGYVINMVSSGGVLDPHPYSTSYASSKTGLMRLTEGLAKEVEEYGIKVFAVAPPAIFTEMTRFILNDPGGKKWRPNFGNIFEEKKDYPPEIVSDLILKLLSGRADKLSGRYFLPHRDNFEKMVEQADDIIAHDLWTLRIRE